MMNYYGYYGHGMGWGFDGLFALAFWVIVVMGIIWALRAVGGCRHSHGSGAIEILKERYAKGEIGKEEYEAKLADLKK